MKSVEGDKGFDFFDGTDAADTPSLVPLWVYLVRKWKKSGHKTLSFCPSHVKKKCTECGNRFPFGLMQSCSADVYRLDGVGRVIVEDGLVRMQPFTLSCESCGKTLKSVCPSLLVK